jgi:hypothetical protein
MFSFSMSNRSREFSWKWVFLAFCIFVAAESVIGAFLGDYILGRHVSHNLRFLIQGLCNVGAYFVGGLIIGIISPGIRIWEPAVAAFLAVACTLSLTVFSPYSFLAFSTNKLLIGGVIAFGMGLSGATLGERMVGNKIE